MTVLLLSFALSSCLVPQSVDPDTTGLPTVPVIDLTQLPSHMLIPMIPLYKQSQVDVDQGCVCHLQLVVPVVKEDDPTVDVEARWFLDYDLGNPATQPRVFTQDFPGSFNSSATIRGALTFDLNADARGIPPNTSHVIEVMLAERQGFALDTQSPPQRALLPGFDATTFKIVVDVKPSGSDQTPCDRNTPIRIPPLQRVCTQ
ncbi:MAG: hypothetical protein ACJ78V_02455 [Myxococcales bacterium]